MEKPNRPPDEIKYLAYLEQVAPKLVRYRAEPRSLFIADYYPDYSPSFEWVYYKMEYWHEPEGTIGYKSYATEEEYRSYEHQELSKRLGARP